MWILEILWFFLGFFLVIGAFLGLRKKKPKKDKE